MDNQIKYARLCDVTNKGMNEGWVWGDGIFYTSTKELTLKQCLEDRENILLGINNLECDLNELETIQSDDDLKELQSAIERSKNNEETESDLLTMGYHTDYLYYTEWDEIDDDHHYLEDGTYIETI